MIHLSFFVYLLEKLKTEKSKAAHGRNVDHMGRKIGKKKDFPAHECISWLNPNRICIRKI